MSLYAEEGRPEIRICLCKASISILLFFCLFLPSLALAGGDPADPVRDLIETLNKHNPSAQRSAALELAKSKDPRALRALVDTLKSPDLNAREYAALGLMEMKDPRSIEALRQSLSEKDKNVVGQVKAALSGFGKAAEPALTRALDDNDPRVGWRAAGILALLGNKSGTDNLLEAVEKGSPGERAEALKVLAFFKEKKALKPLTAALVDKEKDVVKSAAKSLHDWVSSDPSIIPMLLESLKSTKDPLLKIALIRGLMGIPSATAVFLELARSEDVGVRRAAFGALSVSRDREVLPLLLKAMEDQDPVIRQSAAFGLGEWRTEEAIDPLIRYLKEQGLEDAPYASNALVKIGTKAIPKTVLLLKDKDERVRRQAAKILGGLGDPVVFEPLKALLKDPSLDVRMATITSFGHLGDPRASPILIEALKNGDNGIREAARLALTDMGEKAIEPLLNAVKKESGFNAEEVSSILVQIGPRALEPLRHYWKTGDTQQRLLALSAIAGLSGEEDLEIFAAALDAHEEESIRVEAARLLGSFEDSATPLLLRALKDPSPKVRELAAVSLGQVGHPDAVEPLTAALEKDTVEVRKSALVALRKIGDERALPGLTRALTDRDAAVRVLAVGALGEMGNQNTLPALIKLLSDPEGKVRMAAINALGNLKDASATERLVSFLTSDDADVRRIAIENSGEWGNASAIGPLVASLKGSGEEDRQRALLSLAHILQRSKKGEVVLTEGQIGTFVDLLGNPDETTRIRARMVLESLGSQAVSALMRAVKSEGKTMRLNAIIALGAIGDRQATPLLLEALRNDKDLSILKALLTSLAWIGDPKAVTPTIKKLSSDEWEIRAAASFALGKIRDTRAATGLMTLLNDDVEKVRKNVREALEVVIGDSCPVIIALTPFKNADLVLFILMIGLVATPTLRSWVSPFDLILRKAGTFLRAFSGRRVKWWISLFSGVTALAAFVYCVYCGIFLHATEVPSQEFLTNLYHYSLKVFPFFIGGCLISGLVMKYFSKKSRLPTSMGGACVLGALLPICSCGVVPLARAMKSLSIPTRTVIAFLVVTPVLNPFVIFLSHGVIGMQYTLLRIAGTFAVAILMGIIIERVVGTEETDGSGRICQFCKSCTSPDSADSDSGLISGWKLVGLLHRYIIIGTVLGALMTTYMPMSIITKYLGNDILGMAFAVSVGVPLYLCSGEEVILLKPLLDLGLPMGHAIAFTVAANGICITSVAVLMGALGRKTTLMMVVLFWLLSLGLGYLINMIFA